MDMNDEERWIAEQIQSLRDKVRRVTLDRDLHKSRAEAAEVRVAELEKAIK